MQTATQNVLKIGNLTVEFEACEDGHDWHLMTGHGTCWDSFTGRAEAIREARRVERQERAEALRDEIGERLEGCEDLVVLEKIRALLS